MEKILLTMLCIAIYASFGSFAIFMMASEAAFHSVRSTWHLLKSVPGPNSRGILGWKDRGEKVELLLLGGGSLPSSPSLVLRTNRRWRTRRRWRSRGRGSCVGWEGDGGVASPGNYGGLDAAGDGADGDGEGEEDAAPSLLVVGHGGAAELYQ